jgi:APA family basic amino acid/polyamine antiporter
VGVLGLIGIGTVLISAVLTHPIGRVAGPLWVGLGLVLYYFYRRSQGRPFFGSIPRDWSSQQLQVYVESGETELADEYREALERRRRKTE